MLRKIVFRTNQSLKDFQQDMHHLYSDEIYVYQEKENMIFIGTQENLLHFCNYIKMDLTIQFLY